MQISRYRRQMSVTEVTLLRFQKAAVRGNYETGNQAFSKRLRFLTIREGKSRAKRGRWGPAELQLVGLLTIAGVPYVVAFCTADVFPLATPRFSSITMSQVIQPTASQDYLCNGDLSPVIFEPQSVRFLQP